MSSRVSRWIVIVVRTPQTGTLSSRSRRGVGLSLLSLLSLVEERDTFLSGLSRRGTPCLRSRTLQRRSHSRPLQRWVLVRRRMLSRWQQSRPRGSIAVLVLISRWGASWPPLGPPLASAKGPSGDLMIDDRSHLVLACLVWIVLVGLIACEIALVGGILLSVLLDASSSDPDSGPSGAERRSRV